MEVSKPSDRKCIAFTRYRTPCPNLPEKSSKWCVKHEELQGKCMRIYKHQSRELDRYSIENPYPFFTIKQNLQHQEEEQHQHGTTDMIPKAEDVEKIQSVEVLRDWHQIARRTWALANREHHHVQFYQDGDNSHRHFIEILRRKQDILETLMSSIDQRMFQLTISSEEADWLNQRDDEGVTCEPDSTQPVPSSMEDGRTGHPSSTSELLTPPSSPIPCQECDEFRSTDDPEEKLNERKRSVMVRLMNYLELPNHSRDLNLEVRQELKELIRNIFRRIIVRDAGLLMRAKEFQPAPKMYDQTAWKDTYSQCVITEFIRSDQMSLKELERLWNWMKFGKDKIGPELIRNSIADVYRETQNDEVAHPSKRTKKSDRIWVLGGYVWRKASDEPLPRSGSDFLHAFVGCAGCMLSTCKTFEEWIENRRLALVGGRYQGWSEPQEQTVERLLRGLRIVVCHHNSQSKLSKLEKVVPKSKKLKAVYTEVQERYYLHCCMSLSDPRTLNIIDALHALPTTFNLYAQRRDTGEVTHKPQNSSSLWCSRIRSGYSTIERKKQSFTLSTAFKTDENLFEGVLRSPEKAFKQNFRDCWDVLIMDARVGQFQTFIDSVGETILKVMGSKSVEDFIKEEERSEATRRCCGEVSSLACGHPPFSEQSPTSGSLRLCRFMFREPTSEQLCD